MRRYSEDLDDERDRESESHTHTDSHTDTHAHTHAVNANDHRESGVLSEEDLSHSGERTHIRPGSPLSPSQSLAAQYSTNTSPPLLLVVILRTHAE